MEKNTVTENTSSANYMVGRQAELSMLREVLTNTEICDPVAFVEDSMAHPHVQLPIHGPIHCALAAGAIIAAVRNVGFPLPENALEEAIERAEAFPEDSDSRYGIFGPAAGVGIAVSIIAAASSFSRKQRHLALTATAYASSQMLADLPPCGIRDSRIAVIAAAGFLRDFMQIDLPRNPPIRCVALLKNSECAEDECPFFVSFGHLESSASYHD